MILLAKQAISIFVVYTATLMTLASAGYVLSHHIDVMRLIKDKNELAMMIMSGIDFFNAHSGNIIQADTGSRSTMIVSHANVKILV
jgi:hypothetical protein